MSQGEGVGPARGVALSATGALLSVASHCPPPHNERTRTPAPANDGSNPGLHVWLDCPPGAAAVPASASARRPAAAAAAAAAIPAWSLALVA